MDVKLVEQARNKDEEAYAKLIDLTSKKLYYTACTYVNDKDEAKNIVQDVYRNCFEKMYQLKDDSKFESWITVSVANKCRDYLRKNHKYDEVVVSDLNEEELDFESNIEDERMEFKPDANFNYQELKEGLQGVLNELPKVQKMSIILVHLDGLKVKEAAAALQVPEGTVKSSISIGKQKIKNKIEELRKQNKSFYAVAPMPFLVWMLKEEMEKTSVPAFVVHASTIQPPKIPKKEVAAKKAVTTTATKTAATTATKAGAGKVIAGVVAAAVVGSGAVFGGHAIISSLSDSNEKQVVEEVSKPGNSEESESKKTSVKDDTSVYDDIINSRRAYLTGESDTVENGEFDHDLLDLRPRDKSEESNLSYGYIYRDLNGDGISELILGPGFYGNVNVIYTQKDGKAKKCEVENIKISDDIQMGGEIQSDSRMAQIYLLKDGRICMLIHTGVDNYYVGHIDEECRLVIDEYFLDGSQPYGPPFKKWSRSTNRVEDISESEFYSLRDEVFNNVQSIEYKSILEKE